MLLVVPRRILTEQLTYRDECYYILDIVCASSEPVPMSAKILQEILGRNYIKGIKELREKGILFFHSGARNGHSRKWFVHPDYMETVNVKCPQWIANKVKAHHSRENKRVPTKYKGQTSTLQQTHILGVGDNEIVSIVEKEWDADKDAIIREWEEKNKIRISKGREKVVRPTKSVWVNNRVNLIRRELDRLKKRMIYSKTYGDRLYTNATQWPSTVFHFLTLANSKLIRLDIKSCQLVMLYWLAREVEDIPHREIRKFWDLVKSGRFYEDMIFKYWIADDRQDMKKRVAKYLNGQKGNKFFVKEFPHINRWILRMKNANPRFFTIAIPQLESTLMFDHILPLLRRNGIPNNEILTIHDCVITTDRANHSLIAQQVIEQVSEQFNLPLVIDMKPY